MNTMLSTVLKAGGSLWIGNKGRTTLRWVPDRQEFVIDPSFSLRVWPRALLRFNRLHDALDRLYQMYGVVDEVADIYSDIFRLGKTQATLYLGEYGMTYHVDTWYVFYVAGVDCGAHNLISSAANVVLSDHNTLNEALTELTNNTVVATFESEVIKKESGNFNILCGNRKYAIRMLNENLWLLEDLETHYDSNEHRQWEFRNLRELVRWMELYVILLEESTYAENVFDVMLLYDTAFTYRGSNIFPYKSNGSFQIQRGLGFYMFTTLAAVLRIADKIADERERLLSLTR